MHSKARLGSLDYMERVCVLYTGIHHCMRPISKSYVNTHLVEYFFFNCYRQSCGFGVLSTPTSNSVLHSSTTTIYEKQKPEKATKRNRDRTTGQNGI